MANTYMVGNQIKLQATFIVEGTVTDPTTITVRVKDPSGSVTVYTYSVTVTKSTIGVYYVIVTMNLAGTWWVRWEGAGAVAAVEEESVIISDSNVI